MGVSFSRSETDGSSSSASGIGMAFNISSHEQENFASNNSICKLVVHCRNLGVHRILKQSRHMLVGPRAKCTPPNLLVAYSIRKKGSH